MTQVGHRADDGRPGNASATVARVILGAGVEIAARCGVGHVEAGADMRRHVAGDAIVGVTVAAGGIAANAVDAVVTGRRAFAATWLLAVCGEVARASWAGLSDAIAGDVAEVAWGAIAVLATASGARRAAARSLGASPGLGSGKSRKSTNRPAAR